MKNERRFTGQYAEDGKKRRLAARAAAGHRCVRCKHPFVSGQNGRGEWSLCDEQCTHAGPIRFRSAAFSNEWSTSSSQIAFTIGEALRDGRLVRVEAQWRILTVHHLDGDKANDEWWNTLPLCQRCHLEIQGKVDPRIPWFLEHSEWFKPFVAGFYAWKYEGKKISRDEAEARMTELLAYENRQQNVNIAR